MSFKPKAIIFDLGAVLIDLDFSRTINQFLAHAPNLDREVFLGKESQHALYNGYETGKLSTSEIIDRFNQHHQSKLSRELFKEAWNAMILDFPREKIELLQKLKTLSIDLYLLSNINELHAEAALERFSRHSFPFSFHSLFKKVYFSHEIGMRKPDAEAFLHILNENHLKASETLFVDDTRQHIEAAKQLGINALHLTDPKSLLHLIKAYY